MNRVRKEPLDQMRQKKREEQRQNAHNERFRIVNCSRTTTGEETSSSAHSTADVAKEITILDIEKERLGGSVDQNGEEKKDQAASLATTSAVDYPSVSSPLDYVYDLYVPDVNQPELEWSEQFLENMLRFVPASEEIHLTFSYTYF